MFAHPRTSPDTTLDDVEPASTSEQERLDALVATALERRPNAQVILLPREDGQYSDHATDTLALLEEAGLVADYATDPMRAGVFGEKAAELFLPPLLILFSDAATLAGAIEGVIYVFRWFTGKVPRRISVRVVFQQAGDGSWRHETSIDGATGDEAAKILRASGHEAEKILRAATKVRPRR
jgi:hypothetical protein